MFFSHRWCDSRYPTPTCSEHNLGGGIKNLTLDIHQNRPFVQFPTARLAIILFDFRCSCNPTDCPRNEFNSILSLASPKENTWHVTPQYGPHVPTIVICLNRMRRQNPLKHRTTTSECTVMPNSRTSSTGFNHNTIYVKCINGYVCWQPVCENPKCNVSTRPKQESRDR